MLSPVLFQSKVFKATFCLAILTSFFFSSVYGQNWQKLYSNNPNNTNLEFGKGIMDMDDQSLIVGSFVDSSAYLFDIQSGTLSQRFRQRDFSLAHPDPFFGFSQLRFYRFGRWVSIDGNRLGISYNYFLFERGCGMFPNSALGGGTQILERPDPSINWFPIGHADAGPFSKYAEFVDLAGDEILVSGEMIWDYFPGKNCSNMYQYLFELRTHLFLAGIAQGFNRTTKHVDGTNWNFYAPNLHDIYATFSSEQDKIASFIGPDSGYTLKTLKKNMGQNWSTVNVKRDCRGVQCPDAQYKILAFSDEYALVYITSNYNVYFGPEIWAWDSLSQSWTYDAPAPGPITFLSRDEKNYGVINDKIIIGDPNFNNGKGIVNIYQKDQGSWRVVKAIQPSVLQVGDKFGYSLAAKGDRIAIGAPGDDTQGQDAGAVYLYDYNCLLPQGLKVADIGLNGGVNSQFCYDPATKTYEATASGNDIYGTQDGFTFLYKEASNDAEISMQISWNSPSDYWNLCGVMIRDALTPGSPNTFLGFNGGGPQAILQQRDYPMGPTSGTLGSAMLYPTHVKLQKQGNFIFAYESPNGTDWNPVGYTEVSNPNNEFFYIGVAISCPIIGVTNEVVFENLKIDGVQYRKSNPITADPSSIKLTSDYRDQVSKANGTKDFFKVYPRQFSEHLTIENLQGKSEISLQLVDLSGKLILRESSFEKGRLKLDLGHLSAGIYLLKLTQNSQRQVLKVIKQ